MNYTIVRDLDDGLCYYKDDKNNLIGEGFNNAWPFESNGLARVEKTDGNRYYINDKFETVSEGFKYAYGFSSNGLARVKKSNGKWYYINSKCETVSEGYENANEFDSNGLAMVQKSDGKGYYVNENFESVVFNNKITDKKAIEKYIESRAKEESVEEKTEESEVKNSGSGVLASGKKEENSEQTENAESTKNLGTYRKVSGEAKEVLDKFLNGEKKLIDVPDECYLDFDAVQKIFVKITYYYQNLFKRINEQIASLSGDKSPESVEKLIALEKEKNEISENKSKVLCYVSEKIAVMCMKSSFDKYLKDNPTQEQ